MTPTWSTLMPADGEKMTMVAQAAAPPRANANEEEMEARSLWLVHLPQNCRGHATRASDHARPAWICRQLPRHPEQRTVVEFDYGFPT